MDRILSNPIKNGQSLRQRALADAGYFAVLRLFVEGNSIHVKSFLGVSSPYNYFKHTGV